MREAVAVERRSQEKSADDRRTHTRIRLEAEITGRSVTNFFTGFTEDISEGGLFIATLCPPVVGTRIDVAVKISEGDFMLLVGEVMWHRGQGSDVDGCGVRFVGLSDSQLDALRDLLKRMDREPLFYDLDN